MQRKFPIKSTIFIISIFIYWLPFLIISLNAQSHTISSIHELPNSDAVIIFGTLVNESGEISPLLKERLDAGYTILQSEKAKTIVVSNTEKATNIMANYLITKGIHETSIELDTQADKTPDTCSYEKLAYPENRQLIFVSQGFHIPRLLYQCRKLSVSGIAFPAESISTIDRSNYSLWTKLRIRSIRYIREAALTWLVFLNIYK